MEKIKLLYLVPHLSTGGMPQFVLKRIESLKKHEDKIEVFLVEYSQFSDTYIVQRDKIIDMLGDHFFTLGWFTEPEKKDQLIDIIKDNNIDIVHIEEIPEGFESFNRISDDLLNRLYDNNRSWRIVETCHNIWFDYDTSKKFNPEYYCFVIPHHEVQTFRNSPSNKKVIMYPYEDKVKPILEELGIHYDDHRVPMIKKVVEREKLGLDIMKTHILNVGLWTENKNQKEGVEVARLLQDSHPDLHFHFIGNQAENFEGYWKPIMDNLPKNVTVWGERSDVDSFMMACDVMMFNSTFECNPLAIRESIGYGMKILARNLPHYSGMFKEYITTIDGDTENVSKLLIDLINSDSTYKIEDQKDFGDDHLELYRDVMNTPIFYNESIKSDYTINHHFVVNPFLEILGPDGRVFDVKMYDDNVLVYESTLKSNHWLKLNREYFTKWRTEVRENGNIIFDNTLSLKDRRVFISFGSKSLGDTLAWVPYCEEFRKKHGCKLIVSTFLNHLFESQYPEIEFVKPGDIVYDIYAQYQLGWFYGDDGTVDFNNHKRDFKTIPLQQTATDILGLDYEEIRPKLNLPKLNKRKKVGLGIHSTAQSKYWNNPNGWQELVDYLNNAGYECVVYSKEGDGYMGNKYPTGVSIFAGEGLQEVINDMATCEFFIGLSSGLSWLAWACELPIVVISGFSEKWTETSLDTYRVMNESVCHGCFNTERLDPNDWNWCPFHKGTERQFECSKTITSQMVIDEVNKIINKPEPEMASIVLSHHNTKEKRDLLLKNLKNLKSKIILSTNYPVDSEIEELCDFIYFDEENPILLKEEFKKYDSYYFKNSFENGEQKQTLFEYEHGYAVYKLISNGLMLAKDKGFSKVHIINYDYNIDKDTLNNNENHLDHFDGVFYTYDHKSYEQNSYSTGYFSGNVDKLIEVFTYYKTKQDYYSHNTSFRILEIITYDIIKTIGLKIKELSYEKDLSNSELDTITDNHIFEDSYKNDFHRISNHYGCDKTTKHKYHNVYPTFLDKIRNENFSLLEIGIDEGKSLKVWLDYLKNAKIYGIDINREFSHERGHVFKGDQSNLNELESIISKIGKCKVIIDDASHNPEHQVKTFNYLFRELLEDGGYYVIEDVETSYWDPLSSLYGYEIGHLNVVDYFSKLTHVVNFNYNGQKNNMKIQSIAFDSNCIIIKKID